MADIGSFRKNGQEIQGEIVTLSVQAKGVRIVPETNRANDAAPSHRIYIGRIDIGAAWSRRSSEGRDYLSVKLDDPSFSAPIYANLFDNEDGETFSLIMVPRPQAQRRLNKASHNGPPGSLRAGRSRVQETLSLLPCRSGRLKMPRFPQFCRPQRARTYARRSSSTRGKSALRAPLRGACGVLDPARLHGQMTVLAIVSIALVATIVVPTNARLPWLIYNASASAQLGFYGVENLTPSRPRPGGRPAIRNARKSSAEPWCPAPRCASAQARDCVGPRPNLPVRRRCIRQWRSRRRGPRS